MNEDAHSSTGLGLTPRDQTLAESAVDFASDPLIAALKKDVARTLLIDNLRLTFDQRARRMNEFMRALETLIQLKRAAGRPKDLKPIAELEALLEERRRLEASGEIPPGG